MSETKLPLAGNLAALRKEAGMTQAELAEKLNYSDKAVSKWERGEALPDLQTAKQLADLFGVSVDYLIEEKHKATVLTSSRVRKNRLVISLLATMLVWLVATVAFVCMTAPESLASIGWFIRADWLLFVYAVPVSCIVLLVFNSIWGKRWRNFALITVLVWTVLVSVCLSLVMAGLPGRVWLMMTVGVPAQIILILWSRLKRTE